MLLSRVIANFTRGESDALRKAMGKKLIEKLNHMYPKFIKGGTANGYDPKVLEKSGKTGVPSHPMPSTRAMQRVIPGWPIKRPI